MQRTKTSATLEPVILPCYGPNQIIYIDKKVSFTCVESGPQQLISWSILKFSQKKKIFSKILFWTIERFCLKYHVPQKYLS